MQFYMSGGLKQQQQQIFGKRSFFLCGVTRSIALCESALHRRMLKAAYDVFVAETPSTLVAKLFASHGPASLTQSMGYRAWEHLQKKSKLCGAVGLDLGLD